MSPEVAVKVARQISKFLSSKVVAVAVDESHCIQKWYDDTSHNFSNNYYYNCKAYLNLSEKMTTSFRVI